MGPLARGPGGRARPVGAPARPFTRPGDRRLTSSQLPTTPPSTARLFWGTALGVVVVDLVSKLLAEQHLAPRYVPHRIIGNVVRFTLAYNPGAAFSMSLGQYSRFIFAGFALVALVVLWRLYRMTGRGVRSGDSLRVLALGLAWGGAAGNLIDRFRSPQGVVDFIDIGIGDVRFWTFNVADSAVTVGAVLLAWSLSREEREMAKALAASTAGHDVRPDLPPPGP